MVHTDWYSSGYEAATPASEQTSKSDRLYRFWMKPGAETEITFLDDDTKKAVFELTDPEGETIHVKIPLPLIINEHQMKLDGDWRNWFTCLRGTKDNPTGRPCPLCDAGERATEVAIFSCIDHTEWTDKRGGEHKDESKLYVVKTSTPTYALLQKYSASNKGLRGLRFEVSRLGDKATNVGNVLIPQGKSKLNKDQVIPNYLEIFATKTTDELKGILGVEDAEEDQAVPF